MIGAGQKALPPTLHAGDEIPRVKRHQLGPSSGVHLDELAPMLERTYRRHAALLRRVDLRGVILVGTPLGGRQAAKRQRGHARRGFRNGCRRPEYWQPAWLSSLTRRIEP